MDTPNLLKSALQLAIQLLVSDCLQFNSITYRAQCDQAQAMGVHATKDRSKVTCILNETLKQDASTGMGHACVSYGDR